MFTVGGVAVLLGRRALLLVYAISATACVGGSRTFVGGNMQEHALDAPPADAGGAVSPPAASTRPAASTTFGTGLFVTQPPAAGTRPAPQTPPTDGGNSFQFNDAPLDIILAQVLGDTFGVSYAIDPAVQVRMTIRLDGVANGDDAAAAIAAALHLQGVSLSRTPSGYMVSRTQPGATGRFQILGSPTDVATADAAVLVMHHANADEVVRLARPLLPPDIVKLTDPRTGAIVLQGNPQSLAAAVDALRAFDVDWFKAVSSAVIQLERASPSEVKQELEQIMGRTGGLEVVAVPRIGSLYVFARTREILDRAQGVIVQLDRTRQSETQGGTLIYEAKYVSADRLRTVAASLFGFEGSGASTTEPQQGAGSLPMPSRVSGGNGDVSVAIDAASNLVVVRGNSEDLERVSDLFGRIDRPQKQILIETTIVEVGLRDEFRLGVQWDGVADFIDATFTDNSGGGVASKFPGVSVVYANTDIQAVVNALDTKTDIEIVSSPRVLALNNQQARIQVGDQVPIVTQSAVSVNDPGAPIVNSTSYRDTGIILDVTPQVRAGDVIEIKIAQEVSDVAETVTSGIDSPTISTRRIEGTLAVPNGSTVALGGLISSNRSQSRTGVPILMDIPLLGDLFSSSADVTRRSELIVLIRPVVINSDASEVDLSSRLSDALFRVRPEWFRTSP